MYHPATHPKLTRGRRATGCFFALTILVRARGRHPLARGRGRGNQRQRRSEAAGSSAQRGGQDVQIARRLGNFAVRVRGPGGPAGERQLRRSRPDVGGAVSAISESRGAQAGRSRSVSANDLRQGARPAAARPEGERPDHDLRRHQRRRPAGQDQGFHQRIEPGHRRGSGQRRRLRHSISLSTVLPRPRCRRRSRRRSGSAALGLWHQRRPFGGQLADLGTRWLALWRPREHRDGEHPRD